MRDWLATLPIVLLVPALVVPLVAAMAGGGAYLRLSTRDLVAGGSLQVAGGGLSGVSGATLAWDDPDHTLARINPDKDGKFRFEQVNVPADAKEGRHYFMIADADGDVLVKARVQVGASKQILTPIVKLNPRPTAAAAASSEPTSEPSATPGSTTGPTATPKPTAEPTTEPTATPKPTTAPTATPKPTAAPTATPQPTATPTAPPPSSGGRPR